MVTSLTEPRATVVNLLSTNWNSSNCSKPTIIDMMDTGYSSCPNPTSDGDYIRLYDTISLQEVTGLGAGRIKTFIPISIEITTSNTLTQLFSLFNETRRIILTKYGAPGGGYQEIVPKRFNNLSNKHKRLWKIVYDVELKSWGDAI